MTFETELHKALDKLGVRATPSEIGRMRDHFELLTKWNRRMNLTRITDVREAVRRHYGESAFLHRELPEAKSVVDVGSGAGFPGFPFAVMRPETHVTLVESRRRKAAFLREASRSLSNVTVANCRVADWNGVAQWGLLRAVAPTAVLFDLWGRVARVAYLGTRCPQNGSAYDWAGRRIPWSDRKTLWLGTPRPDGLATMQSPSC